MHHLLNKTDHRPYSLNAGPWVMGQDWSDLAFLHWPVESSALRPSIPERFEIDTFDGSAWIGVVPFAMTVRLRGCPVTAMRFLELNVRTYVTCNEKRGVYFFSLDAGSKLTVAGARAFFHLPYFNATMNLSKDGEWSQYESVRVDSRGADSAFVGRYRPVGPPFTAQENTLEHFLVERYCLFVENGGIHYCCDIHHDRWLLQRAEAQIVTNSMVHLAGVDLSQQKPHALYSASIETLEWWLQPFA